MRLAIPTRGMSSQAARCQTKHAWEPSTALPAASCARSSPTGLASTTSASCALACSSFLRLPHVSTPRVVHAPCKCRGGRHAALYRLCVMHHKTSKKKCMNVQSAETQKAYACATTSAPPTPPVLSDHLQSTCHHLL